MRCHFIFYTIFIFLSVHFYSFVNFYKNIWKKKKRKKEIITQFSYNCIYLNADETERSIEGNLINLSSSLKHSGHSSTTSYRRSTIGQRWGYYDKQSAIMSFSCSECCSDLLCGEDSGILTGDRPECSSDFESPAEDEEAIAGLIEEERNYVPGIDYFQRFHSQSLDTSAREKSVEWILKVIDIQLSSSFSITFLFVRTDWLRIYDSDTAHVRISSSIVLPCAGCYC